MYCFQQRYCVELRRFTSIHDAVDQSYRHNGIFFPAYVEHGPIFCLC